MERIAPAGDVYQAGTLSGNPVAVRGRRWPRSRSSTTPPTSSSTRTTDALADGLREAAASAGRAGPGPERPRALTVFFAERARPQLRRRGGLRSRRVRRLVPGAARSRACTRRRRSSRRGSRRSRTPRPSVDRTVEAARGGVRGDRDERGVRSDALRAPGRGARRAAPTAPTPTPRPRPPGPAQLAAAGPRAAGREHDYELLLEMILEGSRLHYGEPQGGPARRPRPRAAARRPAVRARARRAWPRSATSTPWPSSPIVISLVAQAQAAGDAELAEAVWEAGAVAIGWGCDTRLTAAKAAARAHEPDAAARCGPLPRRLATTAADSYLRACNTRLKPAYGRRIWRRTTLARLYAVEAVQPVPQHHEAHVPDRHKPPKSKYTADRNMPGAFEGETVTRRRFMNLHGPGRGPGRRRHLHAPRARFRARRRCSTRRPFEWQPIGPPSDFPDDTYVDEGDRRSSRGSARPASRSPTCGRAIRRSTPSPRTSTTSGSRCRRAACTSAARCATWPPPSGSSARATVASTTSAGWSPAGRRCARSIASTRA